jgi:hypothetical protein
MSWASRSRRDMSSGVSAAEEPASVEGQELKNLERLRQEQKIKQKIV